jgi:hypothetical protein
MGFSVDVSKVIMKVNWRSASHVRWMGVWLAFL